MQATRVSKGKPIRQVSAQARAKVAIAEMTALLEDYARRGVFRGFSCQATRGSKTTYRVAWHRNQEFELAFDGKSNGLRFMQLLSAVPANSEMYRELKAFVASRHADDLPEHRRIDRQKALAQVYNRKGQVSLAIDAIDGDAQYAGRKLVHLANEIFMSFLVEGNYFDYMVEAFDLDPDRM